MDLDHRVKDAIFTESGIISEYYSLYNPGNDSFSIHKKGISDSSILSKKEILGPEDIKDKNILNYITSVVLDKLYQEEAILKIPKREKDLNHNLYHSYLKQTEIRLTGTYSAYTHSDGYFDMPNNPDHYTIIYPEFPGLNENKKLLDIYNEYCRTSDSKEMKMSVNYFREITEAKKIEYGFSEFGNKKDPKCFRISSLVENISSHNYIMTYNLVIFKDSFSITDCESCHSWRIYRFR